MKRAPFINSKPPMMLVGTPSKMTVPRTPIAFVKNPEITPPPKPPMKKMYIAAIAVPIPRSRYGTTAWSTGAVMANADVVSTACGTPRIQNQAELCTEYWIGVKTADGRISAPTSARAWAGLRREGRAKEGPTKGRGGGGARAGGGGGGGRGRKVWGGRCLVWGRGGSARLT